MCTSWMLLSSGMALPGTKQAETEYLARTGSALWEQAKPFSHAGADTLGESAQLLHDFSVAMLMLQPGPDDLILDLGAGGCWCSDLLGRLNRRAIAVDISVDMLRAGRERPTGGAIQAVTGDFEALPFRTGSFQKAVCLSAIHHVPDIGAALKEIARVLDDSGVAFFSEPGKGHAEAPYSTAAMRDFGVLEQDILVSDFTRMCSEAGFQDVRLKPLSYTLPGFDLPPEQWDGWTRLAGSTRSHRLLAKVYRAGLQLFGLGKKGPMFEEALGMTVVRTLHHAMEDHPIVVASKAPRDASATPLVRGARIEVSTAPGSAPGTLHLVVKTVNSGNGAWRATSRSGLGHVALGVQLLDGGGRLLSRDYHRVRLSGDVGPGEAAAFEFDCPLPRDQGAYVLKVDMVAEGIVWFEAVGSATASVPVDVA